jgi:hypothetical protein
MAVEVRLLLRVRPSTRASKWSTAARKYSSTCR